MSRTFRKYQTWIDWIDPEFPDKLKRGTVNIELKVTLVKGSGFPQYKVGEFIWSMEGKRWMRKVIHRNKRRLLKKELRKEIMER